MTRLTGPQIRSTLERDTKFISAPIAKRTVKTYIAVAPLQGSHAIVIRSEEASTIRMTIG